MPLLGGRALAVAATLCVLASCGPTPAATGPTPASRQVIDRLSFGRDIPTGGTVSDSAWLAFLDEVVTPRFPAGFGWMRTEGQWRYADGRIEREAGYALELYHAPGSPPDTTFEAIAREYIRRFHQEAVARVRIPVQEWMYRGVRVDPDRSRPTDN